VGECEWQVAKSETRLAFCLKGKGSTLNNNRNIKLKLV